MSDGKTKVYRCWRKGVHARVARHGQKWALCPAPGAEVILGFGAAELDRVLSQNGFHLSEYEVEPGYIIHLQGGWRGGMDIENDGGYVPDTREALQALDACWEDSPVCEKGPTSYHGTLHEFLGRASQTRLQ